MLRRRLCVVVLTASLPIREGVRVSKILREWRADWMLAGRSKHTIDNYERHLIGLFKLEPDLDAWDMAAVKAWVAGDGSAQTRRMCTRAVNAFLRWCRAEEVTDASHALASGEAPERARDGPGDGHRGRLRVALRQARAPRSQGGAGGAVDPAACAEVARMRVEHLDLDGGNVMVPISKNGTFRVAPLSPEAWEVLRRAYRRRHPQIGDTGPLWLGARGPLGSDAIRQVFERLEAPSSHAWRRGWTVDSLKAGVSQTSVQAVAGWSSGAMVGRYVRQMAGELALSEFSKRWAS